MSASSRVSISVLGLLALAEVLVCLAAYGRGRKTWAYRTGLPNGVTFDAGRGIVGIGWGSGLDELWSARPEGNPPRLFVGREDLPHEWWPAMCLPEPGASGVAEQSWLFVPAWMIVLIFFAVQVVLLYRLRPKRSAHECAKCGYDLRGSPSGLCPECGHRNSPAERHPIQS